MAKRKRKRRKSKWIVIAIKPLSTLFKIENGVREEYIQNTRRSRIEVKVPCPAGRRYEVARGIAAFRKGGK